MAGHELERVLRARRAERTAPVIRDDAADGAVEIELETFCGLDDRFACGQLDRMRSAACVKHIHQHGGDCSESMYLVVRTASAFAGRRAAGAGSHGGVL